MAQQTENLFVTLSGAAAEDLVCVGARIRERLSTISEMRMEFTSKNSSFVPPSILGKAITLETTEGFKFSGIVVKVEDVGFLGSKYVYAAEVRPRVWLTTIGEANRIFQRLSTLDVIREVLQPLGISDTQFPAASRYKPREYCVQYGESNFAFISRLMEEDGLYYHFDHSGAVEKMVVADSPTCPNNEGLIEFTKSNILDGVRAEPDTIYEWSVVGKVVSGAVRLWDYDFLLPNADLKVLTEKKTPSYNFTERYQSVGHYKTANDGELVHAPIIADAHAAERSRVTGLSNHFKVRTGMKFGFKHPDRDTDAADYKVIAATHYLRFDDGSEGSEAKRIARATDMIKFPEEMGLFETEFEVMPDALPFKPLRTTPWPEVPGLLTAIVTGPSEEEIHTDEYGRIRVQFPWDRVGVKDDKSSCWVRTVMPWTGKGYGFIAVPRIGMEVIIQFERGNIDRPICTGMVYNGVNKPPYTLPADMNTLALRTNTTKGGNGYHELSFKDTKDAEKIYFQSERDYELKVKNNAVITIGMESPDKKEGIGDLTQTVYKNMTETIKKGDVTQTIETGSRITTIETDDTTTVRGKSTTKIKGETALTVEDGNQTVTVSNGNQETTVSMGNITVKAEAGSITIEAAQSIKLVVGGNSITIDTAGIKVEGAIVGIKAQGQASMEGALIKVAASGVTTVEGSMVKIN